MSFPLIVSFYTADTLYEIEVETLRKSCQRFNLDCYLEAVPSHGTWVRNCSRKGPFVLRCLEQFKRPILWLDSDAEIKRFPQLFQSLPCDVAAYMPRHLLSGTLYFAFNRSALEVARKWARYCTAQPDTWDQKHLESTLRKMEATTTFVNLPQGYCKVFDNRWNRHAEQTEVIVHHQASRRFRTSVAAN